MKRWKWALLIFELVLFALILVLPQVELPEFLVQGKTAPVAAKLRVSSVPVISAAVLGSIRASVQNFTIDSNADVHGAAVPASPHSRLSLFCVLIC